MLVNNLVLPLLTLAATAPSIDAAHLPFGSKRAHMGLDKLKRGHNLNVAVERRGLAGPETKQGKRLVRRQTGVCPGNSTLIASPSPSDPASSTTASETQSSATESPTASPSPSPPASNSPWSLTDTWVSHFLHQHWSVTAYIWQSGGSFFNNFNFWSYDDPTHGDVQYVDAGTAWNNGLISITSSGDAIMRVETTNWLNRPRQSVRVHGNKMLVFVSFSLAQFRKLMAGRSWNGGLVLMDASHMPHGCGTWPAWWQLGQASWPAGGEIDILEGINEFTENQVSLHTNPGCNMPTDSNNGQTATYTTGNYDSYDCSSANTANQGCGVRDQQTQNAYGASFNNNGGGVYASMSTLA